MKMFLDVKAFHEKFNLPTSDTDIPQTLPEHLQQFRIDFLKEELLEFEEAIENKDLEKQIDGLLDLIYVAHGTLHMMNLPAPLVEACWDEIQRANMSKERCKLDEYDERSKRGHSHDVVKPDNFVPPNLVQILEQYGVKIK